MHTKFATIFMRTVNTPVYIIIFFITLSLWSTVASQAQEIKPPITSNSESSPLPKTTPLTPLAVILKDGIPSNAIDRARMKENLYALLATSGNKRLTKQIKLALRKLYMTSGSPTVNLLMRRSIKAINSKKYAEAQRFLDAVTKLAPDYSEGWNQRAFVFYKRNNLHQATGDLRRALALDPNHFRALEGLGTILREVNNEAGSYKVFKRLLEVNPHSEAAQKAVEDLKRKVESQGI